MAGQDCQQVLRGCLMPALGRRCEMIRQGSAARVGQASRRKPRDVLVLLDTYGDFSICGCVVGRHLAICLNADVAVICNAAHTMADSRRCIVAKATGLRRGTKHCAIGALR